jgi:putative transposase
LRGWRREGGGNLKWRNLRVVQRLVTGAENANGDYAMEKTSTANAAASAFTDAAWFDPIEEALRGRIKEFIEDLVEEEATAVLGRDRYERGSKVGYRNGTRQRQLLGSFGPVELSLPRVRLTGAAGKSEEWHSAVVPRYARMTRQVEALIASAYLSGTNTRRVKRALGALFKGAVGKDVVSRAWRKLKVDWEAWGRRDLAGEGIVRLILDGTVVKVRLDRKATHISLLVVLGIRDDGQKVLLSIRNMGGESEAAWRVVFDDLIARGLPTPRFLIIDGGAGMHKALSALWPEVPTQRCTVHKHRNLLAHAPEAMHDELSSDYNDMIYGASAKEIEARRRAFLRKWRLKCPAVAASLEEAGAHLFTFTRLPDSQWKSARTTNAIERLHEEFKRRIKTQTVLPSAETAVMLFWALLASGQINMRKIDGWKTLPETLAPQSIDLAA